jgi:hypothetical protein
MAVEHSGSMSQPKEPVLGPPPHNKETNMFNIILNASLLILNILWALTCVYEMGKGTKSSPGEVLLALVLLIMFNLGDLVVSVTKYLAALP